MINPKMSTRQAEELFSACKAGDVDRVRRAIAAGADPKKAINKDALITGETPLHVACRYVHALAIKFVS
jgi:ankyrin repeat protein